MSRKIQPLKNMNNSEIAHAWAHARNPRKGSNFRFYESGVLYSYATPIASRQRDGSFILSTLRWSNSTNRHQSYASRSASGIVFRGEVLEVCQPANFIRACLDRAAEKHADAEKTLASHPRRKAQIEALRADAARHFDTAKRAAAHYGLPFDAQSLETLADDMAKALERARKRDAMEKRKRDRAAMVEMQEWLSGERTFAPQHSNAFFRFIDDGQHFLSSLGVHIPLSDMRRAVSFALAKRKEGWRANGERFPVAGYDLQSISKEGVIAGCHRVTWAEVERLAKILSEI